MPNTVRLHRVLTAKPEKVYRAFIEPDAIASWLPPFGYLCTVHELDAKVGGRQRMSIRNFTTVLAVTGATLRTRSPRPARVLDRLEQRLLACRPAFAAVAGHIDFAQRFAAAGEVGGEFTEGSRFGLILR